MPGTETARPHLPCASWQGTTLWASPHPAHAQRTQTCTHVLTPVLTHNSDILRHNHRLSCAHAHRAHLFRHAHMHTRDLAPIHVNTRLAVNSSSCVCLLTHRHVVPHACSCVSIHPYYTLTSCSQHILVPIHTVMSSSGMLTHIYTQHACICSHELTSIITHAHTCSHMIHTCTHSVHTQTCMITHPQPACTHAHTPTTTHLLSQEATRVSGSLGWPGVHRFGKAAASDPDAGSQVPVHCFVVLDSGISPCPRG